MRYASLLVVVLLVFALAPSQAHHLDSWIDRCSDLFDGTAQWYENPPSVDAKTCNVHRTEQGTLHFPLWDFPVLGRAAAVERHHDEWDWVAVDADDLSLRLLIGGQGPSTVVYRFPSDLERVWDLSVQLDASGDYHVVAYVQMETDPLLDGASERHRYHIWWTPGEPAKAEAIHAGEWTHGDHMLERSGDRLYHATSPHFLERVITTEPSRSHVYTTTGGAFEEQIIEGYRVQDLAAAPDGLTGCATDGTAVYYAYESTGWDWTPVPGVDLHGGPLERIFDDVYCDLEVTVEGLAVLVTTSPLIGRDGAPAGEERKNEDGPVMWVAREIGGSWRVEDTGHRFWSEIDLTTDGDFLYVLAMTGSGTSAKWPIPNLLVSRTPVDGSGPWDHAWGNWAHAADLLDDRSTPAVIVDSLWNPPFYYQPDAGAGWGVVVLPE